MTWNSWVTKHTSRRLQRTTKAKTLRKFQWLTWQDKIMTPKWSRKKPKSGLLELSITPIQLALLLRCLRSTESNIDTTISHTRTLAQTLIHNQILILISYHGYREIMPGLTISMITLTKTNSRHKLRKMLRDGKQRLTRL